MIQSNGHRNIFDDKSSKGSKTSVRSRAHSSKSCKSNKVKSEPFKIQNIDWYDSELRKQIENNKYDINNINIEDFNEIYEHFKLDDVLSQPLMSSEIQTQQKSSSKN